MHSNLKLWLLAGVLATWLIEPLAANETEVREAIKGYVAAFNQKDLKKIASMWAENATHMDHDLGQRTDGRENIVRDIEAVFQGPSTIVLAGSVEHVRLVNEQVARVDGQVIVTPSDSEPTVSRFSAILVKQEGAWVIDSMDEMAVPQPQSAAAALAELDWMVGSWKDASGSSPVNTTVRWSIGGSFLVRTFEVGEGDEKTQGTQIIGWDPRAQQIRSWNFDADGSFGDGVWSKNGDQWLIKSSQTLADGGTASGTYVIQLKSNDEFTAQLLGHEVNGEPQPSTAGVTVVRVATTQADDSDASGR